MSLPLVCYSHAIHASICAISSIEYRPILLSELALINISLLGSISELHNPSFRDIYICTGFKTSSVTRMKSWLYSISIFNVSPISSMYFYIWLDHVIILIKDISLFRFKRFSLTIIWPYFYCSFLYMPIEPLEWSLNIFST